MVFIHRFIKGTILLTINNYVKTTELETRKPVFRVCPKLFFGLCLSHLVGLIAHVQKAKLVKSKVFANL